MDIIDVILSKALTPAQLASYIAQAQQATSIATNAANNIDAITEQTNTNNTNSEIALENVNTALAAVDAALDDVSAAANTEIKKLTFSKVFSENNNITSNTLHVVYPDNTSFDVLDIAKYYNTTGPNTDGGITQQAVSVLFEDYNSTLRTINNALNQTIQDVEELKEHGGGSDGDSDTSNLGPQNEGKIVIVGSDGFIAPSVITEDALLSALIKSNDYVLDGAVGIQVDYANRTFTRVQEAITYSAGNDFNEYVMYGGRVRCNVSDDGRITAWYGQSAYKEDGSNGQVMVYQPKFYYMRSFDRTDDINSGKAIRKETLILSATPAPGFKLHPIFKRPDGTELEYVLISAYEGCAQNGSTYISDDGYIDINTAKLSSVANAQPISGNNKQLTILSAEQMAQNRGINWHITNLAYESMMQMLQMVEYGSLNSQASVEDGICNIPNKTTTNCASLTGSTANLGNFTGAAESTINTSNGIITYSEPGTRAISYRGVENPWGNIWRMVGGSNVVGDGSQAGGILYVCTDFNYSDTINSNNYKSLGFILPSAYDWISAFGRSTDEFDWVYIPIECSGANSAVPIGDNLWTTARLNGTNLVAAGGPWHFGSSDGMFYYSFDQGITTSARSLSARLMYIPSVNNIYEANIESWIDRNTKNI